MSWYIFLDKNTGDMVSEGSIVPEHLLGCMETAPDASCQYHVRELAERPDMTTKLWDRGTRQYVDRLPPVLVDRLDDIQARLLADPDFVARWNALNQTQKNQLRTGIMRVLASLVGTRRFRQEDEAVELD